MNKKDLKRALERATRNNTEAARVQAELAGGMATQYLNDFDQAFMEWYRGNQKVTDELIDTIYGMQAHIGRTPRS